ncbi:MAG: SDR family NAD-dependent epimerase/dehydratase, partial [Acidobacteria bacterium]|nr:SDR family NAD-dependent epimerase/dehydratase [Acidobacteriota bacterium]NIO60744.1 SDR family NAD-dependent epimerase/dehydratase [Acidobacteriota bacterium]NIQ31810.1 SDR family NAD-dependent epimerase/dehydratase [Acidobacteriota bacterium]NIQ87471.1 SDR family NAD-dependent epimerase/dehydratase [Acidobacteriota bacterium]
AYRELPEDDPKIRQPDIARASAELGWSPGTDIHEGLRATLEDFRKRLQSPVEKT